MFYVLGNLYFYVIVFLEAIIRSNLCNSLFTLSGSAPLVSFYTVNVAWLLHTLFVYTGLLLSLKWVISFYTSHF